MKCPSCEKEMVEGKVYLSATPFGFFLRGFSHQPVWFQPNGQEALSSVMVLKKHFLPGGDVKPAHRCSRCKTVVFKGE